MKAPGTTGTSLAPSRSPCPVAGALDVLGDKWTLLVVRDLLLGKSTYSELNRSPEGIPTNILAERLRRLERAGIVHKTLYQERPPRYAYRLTDRGRDLGPVLRAMVKWGNRHIPGTLEPPAKAMRAAKPAKRRAD